VPKKFVVQKLVLTAPPTLDRRARDAHLKVNRLWVNVAVCDRLATAEKVVRNVSVDEDTILRIRVKSDRTYVGPPIHTARKTFEID